MEHSAFPNDVVPRIYLRRPHRIPHHTESSPQPQWPSTSLNATLFTLQIQMRHRLYTRQLKSYLKVHTFVRIDKLTAHLIAQIERIEKYEAVCNGQIEKRGVKWENSMIQNP